jgi:hypothetical protein
MSGINSARPSASIDAMICTTSALVVQSENTQSEACRASAQAAHTEAAAERSHILELKKKVRGEQENAKKPGLFSSLINGFGALIGAVALPLAAIIPAVIVAVSSDKEKALLTCNSFVAWMNPAIGGAGLLAKGIEDSDHAKTIQQSQSRVDISSADLDKVRKSMTDSLDAMKASEDRLSAYFDGVSGVMDEESDAAAAATH